jgi:hypothetical protein
MHKSFVSLNNLCNDTVSATNYLCVPGLVTGINSEFYIACKKLWTPDNYKINLVTYGAVAVTDFVKINQLCCGLNRNIRDT